MNSSVRFIGSIASIVMIALGTISMILPEQQIYSCSGTVVAKEGGGYTLTCSGNCGPDFNWKCPDEASAYDASIGNYHYCVNCPAGGEANCCHPRVQTAAPFGAYALGACYGETGGAGCLLLGPCTFVPPLAQNPTTTNAICSGGPPPPPQ